MKNIKVIVLSPTKTVQTGILNAFFYQAYLDGNDIVLAETVEEAAEQIPSFGKVAIIVESQVPCKLFGGRYVCAEYILGKVDAKGGERAKVFVFAENPEDHSSRSGFGGIVEITAHHSNKALSDMVGAHLQNSR